MFTVTDICNIAIQIEQNGAEIYRNASKAVKDPKLAKALADLAKEEENHAEWFKSIQSDQILTTEQKEMEAIGRSLLQDIVKNNSFSLDEKTLENANEPGELITQSIELEQDTILFYEILLDFLDNDQTIEQLKIIIREEQNHITKLETMKEQNGFIPCAYPS